MARRVSRLQRELEKLERDDPVLGEARRRYDAAVARILASAKSRGKRSIADLRIGDTVRWRDLMASVEHVDHGSSLALLSYRRAGYPLRHALVHLAELEIIEGGRT